MTRWHRPFCLWCAEAITQPSQGEQTALITARGSETRWMHKVCRFRSIVGGLNHLKGACLCCGGIAPPDPPEMTRHEAAIAACTYWDKHYA